MNMKKKSTENLGRLAVLVVSCDNYSDLWHPFFTLFKKFWPRCPYPLYLLSNYKKSDINGVTTITVGEDRSWSDNLSYALSNVKEEYVFMFIDDLFITAVVDDERVGKILSWMITNRANYLRLNPVPRPDKPFNEFAGIVSPGAIYRASTVLSVWKKETLLQLLRSGESAWDFEVYGSVRSDKYEGFYSTREKYISYINCVIKGKWQINALKNIRSFGIKIDLTKRKVMTVKETVLFKLVVIRHQIFQVLPGSYQRKIKHILTRGRSNYSLSK